jgi:hypothetical protein
MAQFDLTIQSRRLYPGPEERAYSEVYDAVLYMDYDDEDGLAVALATDEHREKAEIDLDDQEHEGPIEARLSIQAVPPEGLVGNSHEYQIVKTVPTDGDFAFHRAELNVIPITLDAEHTSGGGELQQGGIS